MKMNNVNDIRNMNTQALINEKIICDYQKVLKGEKKSLPKGTWKDDVNAIVIVR